MIASGGDDNALVVSLIKVSRDGLSVAAKGSCLSAHATEITGMNKRKYVKNRIRLFIIFLRNEFNSYPSYMGTCILWVGAALLCFINRETVYKEV